MTKRKKVHACVSISEEIVKYNFDGTRNSTQKVRQKCHCGKERILRRIFLDKVLVWEIKKEWKPK